MYVDWLPEPLQWSALGAQSPDLLGRAERSSPKPHGGAPKARA
jgi:hypothetical protein